MHIEIQFNNINNNNPYSSFSLFLSLLKVSRALTKPTIYLPYLQMISRDKGTNHDLNILD